MRTPLKSIAKAALSRPLPILLILLIGAIGVQTITSCSSGDEPGDNNGGNGTGGGSVTYEGETYKTVVIGTQTWMAKNLNYNPANCATYGRLYDWATAMALPSSCNSSSCANQIQPKHKGICPSGWHIPTYAELKILGNYAGGKDIAGKELKANSGWNNNDGGESGNGTDAHGFSALPGGYYLDGSFLNVGNYGRWWSASDSEIDSHDAFSVRLRYNNENVSDGDDDKSSGFSVRCLKD